MRRSPLRSYTPGPIAGDVVAGHDAADHKVDLVGFKIGAGASKAEIDALEILLGDDLRRLHDLWVYTSRGTGYWGPPKRFGASSEITVLRLVPA